MEKTLDSLSIIGCGWMGLPLAKKAISKGIRVNGSTTKPEKLNALKEIGIDPFLVRFPLDTGSNVIELFNAEMIVINIPPGRRNDDILQVYPKSISQIVDALRLSPKLRGVIFISSTSVYGANHEFINENTELEPKSNSGKALVLAEEIISKSGFKFSILRFGGLAGPDRHPGRFLSGKKQLPNGNQSINFLHLEDAIGVIMHFLPVKLNNEIYNVVSPKHPTKRDFYLKMTEDLGVPPPEFELNSTSSRREISSEKLIHNTGYQFAYPDPLRYTF